MPNQKRPNILVLWGDDIGLWNISAIIPAGSVRNGLCTHQDWFPTLLAAAGEHDIVEKLRKGKKRNGKKFHVHLDGHDMLSCLRGEVKESPRESVFYFNDDGQLVALRFGDWKLVFMEQRAKTLALWAEPFVQLRVVKVFHLRRVPFERADESALGERMDARWLDGIPVSLVFLATALLFVPMSSPAWRCSPRTSCRRCSRLPRSRRAGDDGSRPVRRGGARSAPVHVPHSRARGQ